MEAYSKPRVPKDKLLETKFLNYAKTIANRRQAGIVTNYEIKSYNPPSDDTPIEEIRANLIEICDKEEVGSFYSDYLLRYSSLLPIEQQKTFLMQET